MDLSLDQIIKNQAAAKKPAKKAPGGGAKGKVKAAKVGGKKSPAGKAPGKAKLTGAVGKKALKKQKMNAMDVEMGGMGKGKNAKSKKKGVAGKLADTLKARIAAAVQRRGGTVSSQRKTATPTKAADIKITISGKGGGSAGGKVPGGFAFKPMGGGANGGRGKGVGRGKGKGGGLMAMMRGKQGGRGGGGTPRIVKPGQQQQSKGKAPGGRPQGIGKKARKVVVGGTKQLAGVIGGGRGGKGKGGGRGSKKGGGRGGKTLAQRFGGR